MHISDGVLPTQVAVGCYVLGAAVVAWSTYRTRGDDLPKVALATASFFVASLVHVPLGPTSVHLLIPGIVGVLLGPSAFLAIAVGLTLQSMLFQFGGITALGANALMMGIPALVCGRLFQALRGSSRQRAVAAGALAGALGVALAALILGLLLYSGGEDFLGVAQLALAAHLPVMVIEAAVTGFMVGFLSRVKPELLELPLGSGRQDALGAKA